MGNPIYQLIGLYLKKFPIVRGKWKMWTLVNPYLRKVDFAKKFYPTLLGFEMELDSKEYIDRFIYYWGLWEPDETHFIESVLRPGDRFVDIGANAGFFSLLASRKVGAQGQVHAFEPVPTTADRLRSNVNRNHCENINVYQNAATNQRTSLFINKHGVSETSGQNSMRSSTKDGEHWEVTGVRIDELLEPNPPIRLIKLDIEGAEHLALEGASALLSHAQAPLVLCEITDSFLRELGSSAKKLYRLMSDYGYAFAYDCHNKKLTLLSADEKNAPSTFQRNVVFSKEPLQPA